MIGTHKAPTGRTNIWLTPPKLIRELGPFHMDPCPTPKPRPWETAKFYCEDGLVEEWRGLVFMNPPYHRGEIGRWIEKFLSHGNGIGLTFARTDTPWAQKILEKCDVFFPAGRFHFHYPNGHQSESNSGGPSMIFAIGGRGCRNLLRFSAKRKGVLFR